MRIEIKDIVQVVNEKLSHYAKYGEVLEHLKSGKTNIYTIKLLDDNTVKGWFTGGDLRLVARANGKVIPGDSEDRSSEEIIQPIPRKKKKLPDTAILQQATNTWQPNAWTDWQPGYLQLPSFQAQTNPITVNFDEIIADSQPNQFIVDTNDDEQEE